MAIVIGIGAFSGALATFSYRQVAEARAVRYRLVNGGPVYVDTWTGLICSWEEFSCRNFTTVEKVWRAQLNRSFREAEKEERLRDSVQLNTRKDTLNMVCDTTLKAANC